MRDLTFSDGPMFQRLMSNKEICQGIVERVLNTRISEVENIVTEQSVEPRLGSHGVRMDAVLTSDGETYDIEMQTYRRGRVAKRLRYYQASLDVTTRERLRSASPHLRRLHMHERLPGYGIAGKHPRDHLHRTTVFRLRA